LKISVNQCAILFQFLWDCGLEQSKSEVRRWS
jgi:hypothetical protein